MTAAAVTACSHSLFLSLTPSQPIITLVVFFSSCCCEITSRSALRRRRAPSPSLSRALLLTHSTSLSLSFSHTCSDSASLRPPCSVSQRWVLVPPTPFLPSPSCQRLQATKSPPHSPQDLPTSDWTAQTGATGPAATANHIWPGRGGKRKNCRV